MKRNTRPNSLLPLSSKEEEQETISRNKISLLFDPSLFEVRSELQRDKGIDLIVELKQDGSYTNFRFIIQLKSIATAKLNADESTSYPVDVQNINYLVNYGMPAYYVLYDLSTDSFYFEQAHKAFQALIKKYPSGKLPKQFKIRFFRKLDQENVKGIYQQTLENGLLLRKLTAHIGLNSEMNWQSPGIVIDDENDVYSVDQNLDFIDRFGLLLINRAEFVKIIEIEQRTHPRTVVSPMFNLVCGIAYFQQANLFKGIEFLKKANDEIQSFSPPVRSMLRYNYLYARYLLGMITEDIYKKGITELMSEEELGSFLELDKAYASFCEKKDNIPDEIIIFQNKVYELINKEQQNTHLRIRAYSIIVNIEGKQLIHNLPLNFISLCGRIANLLETEIFKSWQDINELHSERLRNLMRYCMNTQNFLAASNIALDISVWVYEKIFIFHVLKRWDRESFAVLGELDLDERKKLEEEVNKIDRVVKGYETLGHRENTVHALSLKYEILCFLGNFSDAESIAIHIDGIIEKYDMNALKANYLSMINGNSRYSQFLSSFTEHMSKLYRVLKNIGLETYYQQPIPEKYLNDAGKLSQKKIKWMECDFFDLAYPADEYK